MVAWLIQRWREDQRSCWTRTVLKRWNRTSWEGWLVSGASNYTFCLVSITQTSHSSLVGTDWLEQPADQWIKTKGPLRKTNSEDSQDTAPITWLLPRQIWNGGQGGGSTRSFRRWWCDDMAKWHQNGKQDDLTSDKRQLPDQDYGTLWVESENQGVSSICKVGAALDIESSISIDWFIHLTITCPWGRLCDLSTRETFRGDKSHHY